MPKTVGQSAQRAAPVRSAPRPAESLALSDLDTQLMMRVREGCPEAANTLVRRNFDRVARYVSRVLGNQRAIEDISQEVFLNVLSSAPRYKPTARFSTWLYRVATNTALSHLSRNGRQSAHDVHEQDRAGGAAPPDHQMSLDEVRARVTAAVDDLPINQRVALTLFEYEDLTYQQIATVMDLTVEAVRCLLNRARSTLRQKLGDLT